MSLFVCDAMCRDRFHWHVTNWCRCCCRCMHMRAVVAELCSRQALVASRAVTEIRQIYGRCPLDMARMVLVSVAVVAICCPLSLEWKWKFSWTVWTTWMKLVTVSSVSSFLKLGKLGMLCELWWALLLSLRTCRSKKCAPQRSCEWWMNFEWIISQIILGCTQSSLVVNQASIYITGRLLMSEWVQEPCKTSKPLQIYHISVEGLVSDGLSSKDLERFWKIGTNSWCTAQTWLTTTSRPTDFREGWTSNTSIWSLVSLKMLLRCRRPEDFPKLGHCPGKWSEGAFMIFMILGPGIT